MAAREPVGITTRYITQRCRSRGTRRIIMSENIIYCYSGSGNCLDMAKSIATNLGDTDIVMMRKAPVITDATAYKRVGFIVPCHAGGLPIGVKEHIKSVKISPQAYKFAVIQYAGYMGCGLHVIDEIVGLDYWSGISNHCSAIWLMPHYLTMPPTSIEDAQKRVDEAARKIAGSVKLFLKRAEKPPKNPLNAFERSRFPELNKLVAKMMNVNESCTGCGMCSELCPAGNILIIGGRAEIGSKCIGCMSCVEYCPCEAINVGKITQSRERYHNANIKAGDLMQDVIHID